MAVPGKWGFLRTPCIDSAPDLLSVDRDVLIRRLFILCLRSIVAVATLLCVE
jgi:hypothetical protein